MTERDPTADPDAEVWSYTFGERGPDFLLTVRGEAIGRVYLVTYPAGPTWLWAIHCSRRFVAVWKPHIPIGGEVRTKAEAVAALRGAWEIEREWRCELREASATTHGCWPPEALRAAWRGYENPRSS
ncbi:hypothetical protein [Methylorubrum sp. SB2]|uniref:hypothetical protein n=1 Tax=Methylorubrum subtropicum TaxID=3138812 RepID=UPI00313B9EF8